VSDFIQHDLSIGFRSVEHGESGFANGFNLAGFHLIEKQIEISCELSVDIVYGAGESGVRVDVMADAGTEEDKGDGIPVLDETVAFEIDDAEREIANIVIFKGCVDSD
jgi:hypothetical protein